MKKKLVIFGNSLMSEVAYYYFFNFSDYGKGEIIFSCDKKFINSKKKFNCDVISREALINLKKIHLKFLLPLVIQN